ncbi:LysM peptidoglycan-binding domain-containing protein [Deinococcus detaillensis]|uniref:LysM peptidoglycan-binding domain-containing protein n=1 Tax=Deinococcus detaillensis TaxID=2592048 RepID=A0A553V308_9DEIO|nr:LysM peptidoglycan-binding domain-containing protein [Deinococcus detaillensis]
MTACQPTEVSVSRTPTCRTFLSRLSLGRPLASWTLPRRTLVCASLLLPGLALASSGSAASSASSFPAGLSIKVQPKDTAYSLAKKYNLSVDSLLSLNNLSSSNLTVGQLLLVSPPTYTVTKGDTAFSIARKNNLTVDALLSLNNLSSTKVNLGQVLRVVAVSASTANLASGAASSSAVSAASTVISSSITVTPAAVPPVSYAQEAPPSTLLEAALTPPVQTTTASIITTLPPTASADLPSLSTDWLSNAQGLLGVPYVYGGKSRSGTDCSGFVLQVFTPLGLSLPRVSADQAQVGVSVERSNLQSGDLVFFDTEGRGKVTHVGIVVDGNSFINANSFAGRVTIDDLSSRYWATRYLGARRVLGVMAASH